MWQDYVISAGQFVFALAMIPTIRSASKPALISSVITALGLSIFAVCFATLSLWLSVAGTGVGAFTWWIVAAQTFRRGMRPRERHIKVPRRFTVYGEPGHGVTRFSTSIRARDCTCLIECDGVATLINGEVCRAARLRAIREKEDANEH